MYQTFYIDVNEEVTSIIDRLKRSRAQENILVVPKRALVFQSVVNLKLLQKEAERMGREIMVVTSDEHGIGLAERLGVPVQTSFDGMEDETELREDFQPHVAQKKVNSAYVTQQQEEDRAIGSNDFFDASTLEQEEGFEYPQPQQSVNSRQMQAQGNKQYQRPVMRQAGSSYGGQQAQPQYQKMPSYQRADMESRGTMGGNVQRSKQMHRSSSGDMVSGLRRKRSSAAARPMPQSVQPSRMSAQGNYSKGESYGQMNKPRQQALSMNRQPQRIGYPYETKKSTQSSPSLQNYQSGNFQMPGYSGQGAFQSSQTPAKSEKKPSFLKKKKKTKSVGKDIYVSSGIKTKLLGFGMVCILAIVIIGAYLFLPKANITILAATDDWTTELELKSDPSIMSYDSNNFAIPSRLVELELEKRENFPATGESVISDEQAKGKISIYNEFSTASQSLVATTRFVSEDGKVFRLKNNIIVPGMQKVNGEMKPGVIEADVVADEAGGEYNIGPGRFTIPGFKGGPKYDKFYGVSQKAMMGGGMAGNNLKVVSHDDVINAKKALESQVAEELRIQLDDEISMNGEVFIPELSREVVIDSGPSIYEGVATENFEYIVKIKLQALVFSRSDVESILTDVYQRRNEQFDGLGIEFEDFGYSNAQVNFETKVLKIDVAASAKVYPEVSLEQLKSDLLGKNDTEIEAVLKDYAAIREVEINLWPEIIANKIPKNANRVEIELNYL